MTPMPAVAYLVVRDFGSLGIGSTDITSSRDRAYDEFTDAVEAHEPVAVWEIATYGSLPVSIKDATDSFEHEMQEVCIKRGFDLPDVIRFDTPLLAAE